MYLAYKDGEIVGRICGIINQIANEHWKNKKVRFGWFDFIDDFEVSSTLLNAVAEWGKSQGMEILNGPVGFTDFDHQGLLLEGFDYVAPMASLYNFPYYSTHYENLGLTKEADWKKYGYSYFDVIDAAYQPLYNFQPLTKEQKIYYSKMYIPLLNFDFITIVVNEKEEIVGVGIGMPDISYALKKCQGRLFPFGWYHILKALKSKQIDVFNLLLIAVRPDYQNKGVNSLLFYDQIPYFQKYGIKYAETTAILENNIKNRSNWEYFDYKMHKLRRAYIKLI